MIILPKDYLSIHDVGEYFCNKLDYDYEPIIPDTYRKLCKDIFDLVLQDKLVIVFKYIDFLDFDGYLILDTSMAREFLINNTTGINVKGFRIVYKKSNGEDPEQGGNWVQITYDHFVGYNDLYIPKLQLDKLFNIDNVDSNQSINSQMTEGKNNNSGLDKYNLDREIFRETSKAIAEYLWSMDNNESIRTGDMAQQVMSILYKINSDLVPEEKTLRSWLTQVAPHYAKTPGRSSNNESHEITLTMKK